MKNKIAFILCTNDEIKLSECIYYLEQLTVPAGYDVDIFTITDALSMASGYNEGMNSSDAKYKIYLHQDLFILNKNFLTDILSIFQEDRTIGMLGCIGCRNMPSNAYAITAWDTGKIFHNCTPNEKCEYQEASGCPVEVAAIDGCFIATQYDLPWREDLFDGWDFYDISHCYEFHKIGKKIVVPYQETPWCYHDNSYSKLKNYHKYREIFLREYRDFFPIKAENGQISSPSEYNHLAEKSREMIEKLIDAGNMEEVHALFNPPENRGYLALKEYELLSDIYSSEQKQSEKDFFYSKMSTDELLCRLHCLKFLIRRIEFNIGCQKYNLQQLIHNYSIPAIHKTILAYSIHKDEVWKKIFHAIPYPEQSPTEN